MYPYLKHIAEANGIKDHFDKRVVEAYWIGNELLETIEKKKFRRHLLENLNIKKKIGTKPFERVEDAIRKNAVPHHSFHVLSIWKRTGNLDQMHTLESMDQCRISWGTITNIDGPFITVSAESLMLENGKLALGKPTIKKLVRSLESDHDIELLKLGDIVSIHWGIICEVITKKQAATLKKYTLRHIRLANLTI